MPDLGREWRGFLDLGKITREKINVKLLFPGYNLGGYRLDCQ